MFTMGAAIELVNTMSGSKLDSDDAVVAKFGVRADQIVDYLSLMGDSVDNVPGVDKCGPKTAAKWLAEYGSLDAIMAMHAPDMVFENHTAGERVEPLQIRVHREPGVLPAGDGQRRSRQIYAAVGPPRQLGELAKRRVGDHQQPGAW